MLAACSDDRNPGPEITSVVPAIVTTLVATPAAIHGENFFGVAQASLDDEYPPQVDERWQVSIGTTSLASSDVSLVDHQTLDIVVPAGMTPGTYPVTITAPDGRSATLADALAVVRDPIGLTVSVESAGGGAGAAIDARTLRAGETLGVFAVVRDDQDGFLADVEVSWSVDGAIGFIEAGPSTSAIFEARQVGAGVIEAAHPQNAGSNTGEITVVSGDAARVAIMDAPSGGGAEVGDLPGLTTDDVVQLYAVGYDAFDNFVADTDATWLVTGGIGSLPAGPSASASLDLDAPGAGSVQITHASLGGDTTGTLSVAAGRATSIAVVPDTLVINADDSPAAFAVSATDADGNPTSDAGVLAWSIASGPITSIDGTTGILDPGTAGAGTVRATSSYGPADDSGTITVVPGRASVLAVAPDTLTTSADDAPTPFGVTAIDGDGNSTADLGAITWSIASGPITAIDSMTGVFDPQAAGSGAVRATSSYGPIDDSGAVTVTAGVLVSLTVAPDTLAVTADTAPIPFLVMGVDGDGNPTAVGTITWSISSGPITAIDSGTGVFDPTAAGTGTVRATSSIGGIFDDSGIITVDPGNVSSFTVAPDTAATYLGGPTVGFSIIGPVDADGNPTADLGIITWTDDTIGAIDSASGLLTPAIVGVGFVTATSSYGPFDDSGSVTVYASGIVVTDVSAPPDVNRGEALVEVRVTVLNNTAGDARLVSTDLVFSQGAIPLDAEYDVSADYRNVDSIGPSASEILVFRVDVAPAATLGFVDVSATTLAYLTETSQFDSDGNITSWDVLALAQPTALISAPVLPDNRICIGDSVDFIGSTSIGASIWDWSFSGATPSTSSVANPVGIVYDTAGNYPYWLTVTGAAGGQDTTLGPTPIFVGSVTSPRHVTGEIIFETPALPGEAVSIGNLPRIDMAGNGDPTNVLDCSGAALLETDATAYVTVFVDRGEIDVARDLDPLIPGVQVDLHQGTHFDTVDWEVVAPMTEGDGIVYAEYRTQPGNVVTAAGWLPVVLVNDNIKPTINATLPTAPCVSACFGKGERWAFRFSEPMDEAAVLANTIVQFEAPSNCSNGSWVDITASSVLTYDAAARTLYVTPAVQSLSNYSVRVQVFQEATDASSNANALNGGDFSRCAVLEARAVPAVPGLPLVTGISADPVSPDGDTVGDTTAFSVAVDASTKLIRLQIEKGPVMAYESVTPVAGAGTFGVTWNGRDGTGRVLPNGYYLYRLTAENTLGIASAPSIGLIEVRSGVSLVGVPPWM